MNQSAHGTDKVNAILNVHLATGRIGREGCGPFSVTGQPNARGGREVGGLANQLAAHRGFSPAELDRVSRFWNAPNLARTPGLKAVDLFEAARAGRLKALWVMGTNPAVSMPDATRVREALRRLDLLVVSDVVRTDTTRHADVLLPAAAWGEKDGTVTNSERRISRQRAFLPLPDEARPDWQIVTDVARRMGFADPFAYASRPEIFREHAALTAFENDGERLLDLGALSDLPDDAYEALTPVQWPAKRDTPPGGRLLATRFPTPDGRATLIPVRQEGPALAVSRDHPLVLNTGRLRDQWHTMTRTGLAPRLMAHAPEPALDLRPRDAQDLTDGDLVQIDSPLGQALAKLRLTDAQRPGEAFLPMHWSGLFAARASAGPFSNPATDALSGQPELKHVPVRVTKAPTRWAGLLLTRRDIRPTGLLHWSRARVPGGWAYELTGAELPKEGVLLARALLPACACDTLIDYADKRAETWRAASLTPNGTLAEALLVAPPGKLPDRSWLLALLASGEPLTLLERHALLSGRAPTPQPDKGRIVCACMNVGLHEIAAARSGATTVEAIGQITRAGTNYGSCRSEIRELLHAQRLHAAE